MEALAGYGSSDSDVDDEDRVEDDALKEDEGSSYSAKRVHAEDDAAKGNAANCRKVRPRTLSSALPSASEIFEKVAAPTFLSQPKPSPVSYEMKRPPERTKRPESKRTATPVVVAEAVAPQQQATPSVGGAKVGHGKQAVGKAETTRQKNKRKQALGQATFSVKAERECPDIWQGGK